MPLDIGTEIKKDTSSSKAEQNSCREEQEKTYSELRKSEERFKQVAENSGDWIWEIDETGLYTYSSMVVEKILGYEPQEIVGKKYFYDFFAPEMRDDLKKAAFQVFEKKESFKGFINPNFHKNGRQVILETNGSPVTDENGNLRGYRGVDRDITEQSLARKELKKALSLYTATLESTADGILVVDLHGKIQSSNKKFLQLWNIPDSLIEEKDDKKLLEYVLEQLSDPEGFISEVQRLYSNPEESTYDVLKFKDGRIFERFSQPQKIDERIIGRVWSFRDITEKNKAEEKLKKNEEHLSIILNSILTGMVMIDANTHIILDCNSPAEKMIGLPKKEIIGKLCHNFICPAEIGKCPISEFGQTVDMSERILITNDGGKIPILKTVTPITWRERSYYIESFLDISHQKKAEKALWTAEERFRTAAKLASDLIWELDINTGHLEWFGDIDGVLGYLHNEFQRTLKAWENIIHPDDYSRVMNELEKHLEEGKPYDTEYRVRKKDGSFLYWMDCGTTLFDGEGKPDRMIGVCTDVTNRRKSEYKQTELLAQLERVNEELKSFAYVVSHDLKAPLRGVKVLADWIRADYGDKLGEEGKNQMELLVSRVDRMHNLIDGILQYSRVGRAEENVSEVDTGLVVADIIDTISPPENIRITVESKLPVIVCEKTRMIQLFQNLISNAVKYMDKEEGIIKISCVEEDDFWKFSIEDNGPGIDEKYYEKIFQMFQTLSPKDKFESTGVGLTVVKKIVELCGGKVWIQSQVGKGSTFLFTIPRQKVTDKRNKDEELQTNYVS